MSETREESQDKRPLRYRWLDLVMAWPHERIGKYKSVAYFVANRMFDGEIDIFPSLDTLADWCGMSKRTVSTALDALEAEGLIGRKSGGGKSRSSHYWMALPSTLPSNMLQRLDGDTLQGFEAYVARIEAKHCKESADTLQLSATEHIENYTKSIEEPTDSEVVAPPVPTADPADMDLWNEEGISLPRADFSTIAEWPVEWPGETKIRTYHKTVEQARESISMKAIHVLGWSLEDWRANGGTGTTLGQLRVEIETALGAELIVELARRMVGGELTEGDLAHVLAHAGFTHRGARDEAKEAQQ